MAHLTGSVARDILARTADRSVISFAGGLPDPALWRDEVWPAVDPSRFQYGPSEGDADLRTLFATHLQALDLPVEASRVLITSGSQQGLDLIGKLLIAPGTPAAVESPTYLAALQVFRLFEAQLLPLEIDTEGMNPDTLDRLLTERRPSLVYLQPTFQNPSGACASETRRTALAEVLDRHPSVVVVEDDPYRALAYDTPPARPLVSRLRRSRWVYLATTSKTLLPGLRLGYLASSPELFSHLVRLKQAADLHTDRLSQGFALALLRDTAAQAARVERARQHYQAKRNTMAAALADSFGHLGSWEIPPGGMFFWLRLHQARDLAGMLTQAVGDGLTFMPGDPFFPKLENEQHGRFLRLNFTNPSDDEISPGIARLASLFGQNPPILSRATHSSRKIAFSALHSPTSQRSFPPEPQVREL